LIQPDGILAFESHGVAKAILEEFPTHMDQERSEPGAKFDGDVTVTHRFINILEPASMPSDWLFHPRFQNIFDHESFLSNSQSTVPQFLV